MGLRRSFARKRDGTIQVRLGPEERAVLRELPAQLRVLLAESADDPAARRLFPPAYRDRPDHEGEYRRLMGDDLVASHHEALAVLEDTVDADTLTAEQADAWMRALADLRLVLGTRLDVTDDTASTEIDPAGPNAPEMALYHYLSWLQEQIVEALAKGLGR